VVSGSGSKGGEEVEIDAAMDGPVCIAQLLAEAATTPLPDDAGLSAERAEALISEIRAARAYTPLTYTSLMAMTTIRVEAEIRDRLAARASEHGRSLGAELKAMLDEMMWQGIEAGYRRLAADQNEMAAYQAEAAEWTSADLGDLAATAAEEYPEYNS
jgi:plasmid stability protein